MTAVNALAVIDELRSGWYGETSRLRMPPEIRGAWMRLDIARAAVAELIEADRAYDTARREFEEGMFTDWLEISDSQRMKIAASFEEAAIRRMDALAALAQQANKEQRSNDQVQP